VVSPRIQTQSPTASPSIPNHIAEPAMAAIWYLYRSMMSADLEQCPDHGEKYFVLFGLLGLIFVTEVIASFEFVACFLCQ